MKNAFLLGFFVLYSTSSFCQISFDSENMLIDKYQMPSTNTEILTSDLNNDGTKDLISTTSNEGYITVYPNILGDYTSTIPKLILWNPNEYPSGVSTIDIDNDGLLDIIACNRYDNKISWFRNLGDFTFSSIETLLTMTNGPKLTTISDVDNDGINDIIISLTDSHAVVWTKNNGDGTFMNPQLIYIDNNYSAVKILAKDLNNDNLPEIIIGDSGTYIHCSINSGNGVFLPSITLGYANSGKAFDFEDINNDNYPDLVYFSSSDFKRRLNLNDATFGTEISANITTGFGEIKFKDIDNDGITDIVGSNGNNISSMKRFSNGTFGNLQLLINSSPVTYFIADNLNGDNYTDFIIPSYNPNNSSNVKRLSEFIGGLNSFSEKLISFFDSAVFTVKIADLDNDGNNDIISSYKAIVWNKNKGNGNFTSYKKITTAFPLANSFAFDIEIADLDNDNDKDIVASTQSGIEIYYNDGNGNFTLGSTIPVPYTSRNIELADLNGDMLIDIVTTFKISGSSGEISIAWIPNLNGTNFGSLTTIGLSSYGYQPYLIVCTDMDNDGDVDIVSYSNDYSRIHLHTNNGSGVFSLSLIQNPISAISIAVEDYDNDGYKDIFTGGGNTYPGIYLIKNNGGSFDTKSLIQLKIADALKFADLNGDGLKELIGTASEASGLGTLFYFTNNGNDFSNQILINSENYDSAIRDIALGDLNNDNKIDIAQSFYYSYKTSFFLNSSTTLSISEIEIEDKLIIYPIPFTEVLNWKIPNNNNEYSDIKIFDQNGKLVYFQNKIITNSLDLNFLPKGIYILHLKMDNKEFSRKIIRS